VFAWKGETLEEYWWCTRAGADLADGQTANMLLDDGGDATLMLIKGAEFEKPAPSPHPKTDDPEDWVELLKCSRRPTRMTPVWTKALANVKGVTRRPPPACIASTRWPKAATLPFPAINVNDSVTKSKFDNVYGCRHSLVDGDHARDRRDAQRQGRGGLRLRRCGQGLAARALTGQGVRVKVTEIDPICALQACMEGLEVVTARGRDRPGRHLRHHHRQPRHHHGRHMAKMKDKAIVCNIGHFDNEIDMAGLAKTPGIEKIEIKPQVHQWVFPDGHSVIVLAEGRLVNLGCATGHPAS
jgi:adenosylhomocysteinase